MVEINIEDVTFLIDSREQLPFDFFAISERLSQTAKKPISLKSKIGTLTTGDYSIEGLENHICIERKAPDDLLGCIGNGRERFERELKRMLSYPARCIVVECPYSALEAGIFRSKISPSAITGSIIGWMELGIPFFFASDALSAGIFATRFMTRSAIRRFRELQALIPSLHK